MGHQLLGRLPQSRAWREVVALIGNGAELDAIAAAASRAAEFSMMDASEDFTVQYAFWLLAKIPLAAREQQFGQALQELGLEVGDQPTLTDVIAASMDAIDIESARDGRRSDFGELAQLSVAEALHAVIGREDQDLFGPTPNTTQAAFAGFT